MSGALKVLTGPDTWEIVGGQGAKGDKGDPGNDGTPGPTGPTGATGAQGPQGVAGTAGAAGTPGVGVPVGGAAGQALVKVDATNYNTQWSTIATGGAHATTHASAGSDPVLLSQSQITGLTAALTAKADTTAVTSAIAAHEADTTAVHGIADTSLLVTTSALTTALSSKADKSTAVTTTAPLTGTTTLAGPITLGINQFSSSTTAPGVVPGANGIGASAFLRADGTWASPGGPDLSAYATDVEVAAAVAAHEADTTNVHGITNTALLATTANLTAHEADTTAIHGIADTSLLVTLAGTQTLTNKTINLTSNTLSGTRAQFDIAISDADFYTTGGTDVAVVDGGTGRSTGGTAYGLIAAGNPATAAQQTIDPGTLGHILVSGGPLGLATFRAGTKNDVGLGNVDNTSDATKPVSGPQQIALDTVELRERSKGGGLIVNGTGYLGSNFNFTQSTFVPTDHPAGTSGSFLVAAPLNSSCQTDEYIPVNPNNSYVIGAWMRETNPAAVGANTYLGIQPFDVSNLSISPQFVSWQPNTLTTLAVALNPGNTTVTLTSAANWNNAAGAATYLRGIIFWNYTDATGYTWPTETYSRNAFFDLYADGGISGTVITLRVPWAGSAVAAGTPVSNTNSGGTYMYNAWAASSCPMTWTWRDSKLTPYGGVTTGGAVPALKFPISTAKVKIIALGNRVANSRTAFAGLIFEEYGHNHASTDIYGAPFISQAAIPEYRLIETDQVAESTTWRMLSNSGVLNFISTLDNLTAVATVAVSRAGLLTAPSFSGVGTLLSALNATNITSGTLNNLRLNTLIDSNTTGTARKLETARLISLTGDVTGSINFDGSTDVSLPTTISINALTLGTDTTGAYVAQIIGTTDQVNVTSNNVETANVTLSLPQSIALTSAPTFNRLTLSQTTGTSPFVVGSTTVVTNLNADQLDGEHGTAFHDLTNATNNLPPARAVGLYTGITRVGVLDQLQVSGPTQFSTGPMVFNATSGLYDNPVWHKGLMGTGSGLDADKLDGKDSTAFVDIPMLGTLLGDLLYVGLYDAAAYVGTDATKPHPVWSKGTNTYRHSMYWIVGTQGISHNYLDTDYSGRYDESLVFTVTNKVLTSNVATLTTSIPHNVTVGKKLLIEGVDTVFNGRYVAIAPITATTFSYAKVNTNVATAGATGTATSYSDEQINVYIGDWIVAIDPVVGAPGHEPGTDLTIGQVTFQYIPFSAESYVTARLAAHMNDAGDPHSAAGYLTSTTAAPIFAPKIHEHLADIQREIAAHEAKDDPHTKYQTETESDLRYSLLTHLHSGVYEDAGAVTRHEEKADPHQAAGYITLTTGNTLYSLNGHLHEGVYSKVGHTHDWLTEKEIQSTDSASSSKLYVGDIPPLIPMAGDLWLETVSIGVQAPPVPTVTLTPSPTQVIVAWEFPDPPTAVQLDWSLDGSTGWTPLVGATTPYTHGSRDERTQYYYRVRGQNGSLWGEYRITSAFTTNAPPAPPSGLLTSSLTATGVTLTWTAPAETTNDPLASTNRYEVFLNGVLKTSTNALSYAFTGLSEDVTYTLGVRAKDKVGPNDDPLTFVPLYSTLTTTSITTTHLAPAVPTLPGTPTTKTHNSITLTWNAVSEPDLKEYVLTRTGLPAFSSVTTTATSYTFTGLSPSTSYTVSVAARDTLLATSATVSPGAITTNATPPDTTGPPPATGLSLKPATTYGHMMAFFTTPATDVTQYNINTSINGVFNASTGWTPVAVSTTIAPVFLVTGTNGLNQTIGAELQLADAAGNISSQNFTSYTLATTPAVFYADSTNQWRPTNGGRWGGAGNQNPYTDYLSDPALNAVGAWFYGTKILDKLAGRTLDTVALNPVEIYMVRQAGGAGTAVRPTYLTHTMTTNPGNVSGVLIPTLTNAHVPTTYDLLVNVGTWVGLNATIGGALIAGTQKGIAVYDSTPVGTSQYAKFASVAEHSASGVLRIYHLG